MAVFGTAAIGAGAAIFTTAYAASTGFVARHEGVLNHSLQVNETRRHLADIEAAYGRGEVSEEDWRIYRTLRTE